MKLNVINILSMLCIIILFSNLTDYFSTNKYFTYVDVRFGNIKRELEKHHFFFRIDELTFLVAQSARLTN